MAVDASSRAARVVTQVASWRRWPLTRHDLTRAPLEFLAATQQRVQPAACAFGQAWRCSQRSAVFALGPLCTGRICCLQGAPAPTKRTPASTLRITTRRRARAIALAAAAIDTWPAGVASRRRAERRRSTSVSAPTALISMRTRRNARGCRCACRRSTARWCAPVKHIARIRID